MKYNLAILSVFLGPGLLFGQDDLAEGQKLYGSHCAGCHGADARGTDRGPGLAANKRVRARSVEQLRIFIRDGVPDAGMRGFDLPREQLYALPALLRSLNAPAAESVAVGDATAGKQFFFGKGQCASCHMVRGGGKAVGPDLSDAGAKWSVDELRQALLNPNAHIAPGFEMVTVKLKDGQAIRGFAKNRSNFDIVVQDMEGRFHSLPQDRVPAIEEEKQSLMQPVKASADEMQNLIAYLGRLTGIKPDTPADTGPAG